MVYEEGSMRTKKQTWMNLSRREFLGALWAISLAGLFGQTAFGLLKFFRPRQEPGSFGGIVVAGTPEEFEPGTVSHIQQGRFYISRLEDGGMLALWQRCSHLGCTVPWREDEGQFHCPCHSSLFDRRGELTGGPAPRPMDVFPIALVEGKLVVDTSSPIQRTGFDQSQVFFP
jgi:cytochrome b6-f complex iron-sulfur subunit